MVSVIRFCGKHLSRYVSILFIICINFTILIISLTSKEINNRSILINIINSIFLFVINIFVIVLPNLKICKKLTYKYNRSPPLINYPQTQITQINNNVTINNSLENKNNEINNPAPLADNLNSLENKKNNKINIIDNSNNDSTEINSNRILNYGNMGIPPLPKQKIEEKK